MNSKSRHKLLFLSIAGGAATLAAAWGHAAEARAPLRDPALVNIGFVCRWQERCMERQEKAMKRALGFVRKTDPPEWKVQLCNRNASRGRTRVDWIGFNNCIRNKALRPPAARRRR